MVGFVLNYLACVAGYVITGRMRRDSSICERRKRYMKSLKIKCLFALCALVIAANGFCNGSKQETGSGKKAELVLWTAQRADLAIREKKLAEFNAANPDIQVKMEIFTENFLSTLELSYASGQSPDIFQVADNNASYFVERNMVQPLDKYITPAYKARFGDLYSIDQVNTVNGKVYTLPERGVTYRLLYNKDIFDKVGISAPPKTLDELYEYSKKITDWGKKDGIYGIGMQLKTPFSVGERVFDQIGFRNSIAAYNFKTGKYDYSVIKPVVDVFRRLYAEQIMFPGVEGLEIDPLRTQFADGKIAMYYNGSWEPTIYAPGGQFPHKYRWGAAPLPGIKTATPTGRTDIKNAGKSWAISSSCKNPDAAWKYIEFLLSDQYMTDYHEGGYGMVIIPSVTAKAKAPAIPGWEDFTMNPALETIWPVRPDTVGLQVEGRNAYDTYVAIVLGAVNIDTALADLTARYNTALDKAVAEGSLKRIINTAFNPAAK
jgi:multiple sugar transport system substrate-binding protein